MPWRVVSAQPPAELIQPIAACQSSSRIFPKQLPNRLLVIFSKMEVACFAIEIGSFSSNDSSSGSDIFQIVSGVIQRAINHYCQHILHESRYDQRTTCD